jgi:hypothetical protein
MEILKLDMFYKVKSLHKFEEKVFLSFVSNSDYDSKLNQDRYKLIVELSPIEHNRTYTCNKT